jgi:hypothetical protein
MTQVAKRRGPKPMSESKLLLEQACTQYLTFVIADRSGLSGTQLEQIFGMCASYWSRLRRGERLLDVIARDRIARIAVKNGWLDPVPPYTHLNSLAEEAYGSIRGAALLPGHQLGQEEMRELKAFRDRVAEFWLNVRCEREEFETLKSEALRSLNALHAFFLAKKPADDDFLPIGPLFGAGWHSIPSLMDHINRLWITHSAPDEGPPFDERWDDQSLKMATALRLSKGRVAA